MTTASTPTTAAAFVRRLLTANAAMRRRLLAAPGLPEDALREALALLDDEAVRLHGVDPRRMEQICLDALALATAAGDEFMQAMARLHQADALRGQGRNTEALDIYDDAATAFRRLNRPVEAARTRTGWAWAMAALGKYMEAVAGARGARRVLVAHGETFRAAGVDLVTGIIYRQQGRHRLALRWYTRALARYSSADRDGSSNIALSMAWCHANRGMVLTHLGRHHEALAELEIARTTFSNMGEAVSAARVTRTFGQTQMELGRYASALRSLSQAHAAFRALNLHHEVLEIAYTMADCYLLLNRPADTLAVLAGTEQGGDRTDDSLEVSTGIATRRVAALLQLDRRDEALAVLDDAEQIAALSSLQQRAWLAVQRARVLVRDGNSDEALTAARRARHLARAAGTRRLSVDATILEGAALLDLGRIDEAGRIAAKARQLAVVVDAAPLLHRAYELLGRIAEAHGLPGVARRHYGEAIRHLEREQQGVIFEFRDSFAATRGTAYERLTSLLLEVGQPAEALATAERAKSRALADAVSGAVKLRPRGSTAARRLLRELAAAREQYAAAFAHAAAKASGAAAAGEFDLASLAQFEDRIAALVRQSQFLSDAGDAADIHGLPTARVPPALPDGHALIEFFLSGDDVLRFVVDHSGVAGAVLPGALPEIERLLRLFRLNLDAAEGAPAESLRRLAEQARAILRQLYDRLLGGLDAHAAYRSLVIVPHGLLHYLPFHALHDGERYLVEQLPISYAPSAALYGICVARARRRLPRGGALVLAHSSGGSLPFALAEAEAVAGVLGVCSRREAAATRAALDMEGRRAPVIHIAAHGRFRADAPLFSHIELADGPLTTADVFNLELRASLVTLSACETGRAVLGGGDELVGLARAFLYAGAGALLVSQWRVDDASTAVLMRHFYEAAAEGAGAASALRAAQVAAISGGVPQDGRSHPFFWAGFQVIGGDHTLKHNRTNT